MENSEIKNHQIKVNLPGGIISVGDLSVMLDILEKAGIENIRFGTRQQLYFTATSAQLEDIEHGFLISDTDFETDADRHPNIVSSYVAEDLFNNSNWLREGVYKDILDNFNYSPGLKINLIDDSQTLIPFFSGNLNFISSDIGSYWHLYIRFPKTNIIYYWSSLVYSEDIPALTEAIESIILTRRDLYFDQPEIEGQQLETMVKATSSFVSQPASTPLKLPDFQLPYYEGFNKYNEKYWLGIYRRNELFPLVFLKDLCDICSRTRIAQLYTTPWKSIIIKGVAPADRKLWNTALDKNRINVRHASNELNWQTEDLCEEGIKLKHELIKGFNAADLRTFKLCFAIKINPKSGLFGSVIIRKQTPEAGDDRFDLLHTLNFNPNSKHYLSYATGISRAALLPGLTELCEAYYQQQTLVAGKQEDHYYETSSQAEPELTYVYQCRHCLSIYDEAWGEESLSIPAGTPFSALPENYCCPLCESGPGEFNSIIKETLNTL
ncbi:rubredoxin domain-containing protein [Pedobacter caeni]|uniref:Rubredoxin n=1 Tax=Pedobacter caeni TaxID=288992 RepID=A0A1M4U283_9SPHI|nr:rubredoxin domain-containing protein [Pedobacter caeni]SHE50921.1 Rubredoxin [Pedobacter caeni]